MQAFLYLFFAVIFTVPYFSKILEILPRPVAWLPEVMTIFVTVFLLLRFLHQKWIAMRPIYLVFFFAFFVQVLCGIELNAVAPGTIFVALRTYLRYIPFFFLPAIFHFTDDEMRRQVRFLLLFSLLQLPVATYQRLFSSQADLLTGDIVRGTVSVSSSLTVYLLSAIAVLLGFYLKKTISLRRFLLLALMLFLPTTMNETKGTLFLLPMTLFVPVLFMKNSPEKTRKIAAAIIITTVMLALFIPIYDHFMRPRWGYGLLDFLTMQNRLAGYIAPQISGLSESKLGRLDAVVLPITTFANDIPHLLFGVGIGNASESWFPGFAGEFMDYREMVRGAMSQLLWEVGLGGALLSIWLFYLVLKDCKRVRDGDDIAASIAQGWTGVLALTLVTTVYINSLAVEVVGYLFWYLSGYIASRRVLMEAEERKRRRMEEEEHWALNSGIAPLPRPDAR